MKLLMDADCLIKLTKAGLKELIAEDAVISIPETVRRGSFGACWRRIQDSRFKIQNCR